MPRSRSAPITRKMSRDNLWRQAEAWFVQQQQFRLAHQGAAERQHLPLAAGQGAGGLPAAFGQAGKDAEHLGHRRRQIARALAPTGEGAELKVVLDAHVGEQGAGFGDQDDAALHHPAGVAGGLAHERDVAGAGQQAHDRVHQGGFSGAVRADDGDDLPFRRWTG